ncbi:putrescine transport system permease protein [Rhizobium pisi]|uniref:ABC transporter permease n=1 Tax=Rhizobium pisi TaxID=574561 RepID=A0A3R9AQP4_9HYPH|nr:ABC transporter permease [Rhizobium pisi]MBB3135877.1 putrescine transport system permease protein [Rhizobium pisi]RSB75754.1 ABC transporter permease [Rhizobium pisi]TCA49403.1 ABC transporter permease [Rhizobium pisi]
MSDANALSWFNRLSIFTVMAFLYLPIAILIVFSFNESRLVTVWGGFSTQWYASALSNAALIDGARVSFTVAAVSATVATLLGLLAALVAVRIRRFRGRRLFLGLLAAPMVMPEVVLGVSMLLMFVTLGIDRGPLTIILAHATFTMCFAAVVLQSRLTELDPSLEEAARDLGCQPATAFLKVAMPNILPALISAWLLSFTLSLDDLVISSFTTGPGASTLPMKIYSQIKFGVTPEINAVSTMILGIVAFGLLVVSVITRRSDQRFPGH